MTIERNYLKGSEIRYIGEMICSMENADFITKDYIKYLTVADFCTDFKLDRQIDENGEETINWTEDNYNKLWENNYIEILDNEIKNIGLIDKFVADVQSTYNMFKVFATRIEESMKSFDINETKDVIGQLGNLINKEEK